VRMDDDYFTTFAPEEIATHIRMSAALGSKQRVQVRVSPRPARDSGAGVFDIIIVGFDYLSEFSIFCGMLSAFGLDIRAGNIYSFLPAGQRRSPTRIVDVFSVSIENGEVFDDIKQRNLGHELEAFANLLAGGAIGEARE